LYDFLPVTPEGRFPRCLQEHERLGPQATKRLLLKDTLKRCNFQAFTAFLSTGSMLNPDGAPTVGPSTTMGACAFAASGRESHVPDLVERLVERKRLEALAASARPKFVSEDTAEVALPLCQDPQGLVGPTTSPGSAYTRPKGIVLSHAATPPWHAELKRKTSELSESLGSFRRQKPLPAGAGFGAMEANVASLRRAAVAVPTSASPPSLMARAAAVAASRAEDAKYLAYTKWKGPVGVGVRGSQDLGRTQPPLGGSSYELPTQSQGPLESEPERQAVTPGSEGIGHAPPPEGRAATPPPALCSRVKPAGFGSVAEVAPVLPSATAFLAPLASEQGGQFESPGSQGVGPVPPFGGSAAAPPPSLCSRVKPAGFGAVVECGSEIPSATAFPILGMSSRVKPVAF
jgi:hypothetical protein